MISTVTDLNERFEALSKSLDDKIKGGDGKRHIVLCGGESKTRLLLTRLAASVSAHRDLS